MCFKIYLLFYSALLAISPYYSLFYSDYSLSNVLRDVGMDFVEKQSFAGT